MFSYKILGNRLDTTLTFISILICGSTVGELQTDNLIRVQSCLLYPRNIPLTALNGVHWPLRFTNKVFAAKSDRVCKSEIYNNVMLIPIPRINCIADFDCSKIPALEGLMNYNTLYTFSYCHTTFIWITQFTTVSIYYCICTWIKQVFIWVSINIMKEFVKQVSFAPIRQPFEVSNRYRRSIHAHGSFITTILRIFYTSSKEPCNILQKKKRKGDVCLCIVLEVCAKRLKPD